MAITRFQIARQLMQEGGVPNGLGKMVDETMVKTILS